MTIDILPNTKQFKFTLILGLTLSTTACNMKDPTAVIFDAFYGDTSSYEERVAEYKATHNFDAVTKGLEIDGENFLYFYTLTRNPSVSSQDKEKIAKTTWAYLNAGDEFEQHATLPAIKDAINKNINKAQPDLKALLITTQFPDGQLLGKYDFKRGGYPLKQVITSKKFEISDHFSSHELDNTGVIPTTQLLAQHHRTKKPQRMTVAVTFKMNDDNNTVFIPMNVSEAKEFKRKLNENGSFMKVFSQITRTGKEVISDDISDKLATPLPGSEILDVYKTTIPTIETKVKRVEFYQMVNKTAIKISESI